MSWCDLWRTSFIMNKVWCFVRFNKFCFKPQLNSHSSCICSCFYSESFNSTGRIVSIYCTFCCNHLKVAIVGVSHYLTLPFYQLCLSWTATVVHNKDQPKILPKSLINARKICSKICLILSNFDKKLSVAFSPLDVLTIIKMNCTSLKIFDRL